MNGPPRFWRYFLPAFAVAALVFTLFPQIDLAFSALFFEPDKSWLRGAQAETWRTILNYASWAAVAAVVIVAFMAVKDRRIRVQAISFIVLCYALAPGLIVNGGLKQYWGRARPIQVVEFGGDKQFTPALLPTDQCSRNCSFSSGEAALGFAAAAPALLLVGWMRWAALGAGLAVGVALSAVRILQGGHFLSDTVFSALIVWFSAWLSYALVFGPLLPGLWQRRRGAPKLG